MFVIEMNMKFIAANMYAYACCLIFIYPYELQILLTILCTWEPELIIDFMLVKHLQNE